MSEGLIGLEEAATYLGYKPKGLRQIIDRSKRRLRGYPVNGPTIRFFQIGSKAEIKFRREWLDEFIDACTHDPDSVPMVKSSNRPGKARAR